MKSDVIRPAAARSALAAVLAFAIASGPLPANAASPAPPVNAWGVPLTDVTPDPAIVYGRLANGMRYAIMGNATPKGNASVRLRFGFGSIGEGDDELGLAHFIEHMAFNGSTNVPEGEMIKVLERQGLAFGPDTNAITGFDTTTYMLDLPKSDAEHLDTALFLLREVASEVKFEPAAVDRERGIIFGEKRARNSFQLRQLVDSLRFQYPDTPYPRRIPIGTDEVLQNAPAATLKSLYQRYYRPDNATLVFVGDADPKEIEAKIKAKFDDWKAVGPAGAPLPRGKVDLTRRTAFDTFIDPAVPSMVDITVARPWASPPDTLAQRRQILVESIAASMFNRRIQKLAATAGSPLFGGGMFTDEQEDAARITSVKIVAKDGAWKEALTAAEQELRKALEHGFTAAELKTQLADTTAAFRTAAEQSNTRTNAALADSILSVVDEPKFVTTPAYRLARINEIAPALTVAQVNAVFRDLWKGSEPLVHVSAKEEIAPTLIAAAYADSRKVVLAAQSEAAVQAFAYDSFGPAGQVAADTKVADLGLRTVRFANNVRLNIKKTDFEAGKVRYLVRMGSGQLDLPKDKPGMAVMLAMTAGIGGVGKHSLEELKELMAGKVINVGSNITDDAFITNGSTTSADLATQLKVSAAYMLDPGFRPEAASQWVNTVPVIDGQINSQPQSVAQTRLPIEMTGDPRFGIPAGAILAQRNFAEAKAALAPVIADAPIEITIVGDIDEAAAIAAVLQSFGALTERKLAAQPSPATRAAAFRSDRSSFLLKHDGPADQAMVETLWPTADDSNYREVVGLEMLKDVLDLMLMESVRETLGSSYAVQLQSVNSTAYTGFGYIAAAAVVAPDKADEVEKAFAEAAAELRDKPIPADLLARARAPELEGADRALRDNDFWLTSLARAQSEPERLERIRLYRSIRESIAGAELQALARKYLVPSKARTALIVSSKLETAAK